MENFSTTFGVSSRDHRESNGEKNHFRNKFYAPWTTEQSYPAAASWHVKHQNRRRNWYDNRHSHGSDPSGNHAHGFSYNQRGKGKMIAYDGQHEETGIHPNCQRPIGNYISEEKNRYRRYDQQAGTSILGAYPRDNRNYNNHQNCIADGTSGGNYKYNAHNTSTYFCGRQRNGFSNYNNNQKYTTGRVLEEKYRPSQLRGTYIARAHYKDNGNYYNGQNSRTSYASRGNSRFDRLPVRPRGRLHISGHHAPYSQYRLSKFHSDSMINGNDVHPPKIGQCQATVMVPTCSEDATSVAVSLQNVSVISDATLHDRLDKPNGSEFNTKDENNGNTIDSKDSCPEGKESSLHVCNQINEGDKEADKHEANVCSDGASASPQLGQIEPIALSKSIFQTRRKLLVLDLNGILVDVAHVPYADKIYANREHINVSRKTAFKRPFCDEFLNFCFNAFDIGIWSSRMKHNVDIVVDYLMGNMKKKLLFCWDNKMCSSTGFNTIEDVHKPLVLKELNKLWDKEDLDLPWEKSAYTASNTLLIDDSPYKALCNPPHTGIFPEPYRFRNENDNSLGAGGDLRVFLEGLVKADNVQEYVSKNPIGQRTITNSNPSWKFYLQVIERVEQRKKVTV